jgi:hypothetical protein
MTKAMNEVRPCVFIHTNERQMLGARVGEYALKRNSPNADKFDVRILKTEDYPFIRAKEGLPFMRNGVERIWDYDDLQSFTPLRFLPPQIMGYQGRAVVTDPDIFAVGDIWELLSRDMGGKAILCRMRSGPKKWSGCWASSVMLLDCAKLSHWHSEEQFNELFDFSRDYMDWISLKLEPRDSIGLLEDQWNDFDRLTADTKMLHNTRRLTQPWKTGLPIDFTIAETFPPFPPVGWVMRRVQGLFENNKLPLRYKRHPDRNQERLFFGLLRECLDEGSVSEAMLKAEMEQDHVRHDAFEMLAQTPALAA